jgi:hypothetical protein
MPGSLSQHNKVPWPCVLQAELLSDANPPAVLSTLDELAGSRQVYETQAEMAVEEENIRRTTTPAYRAPEVRGLRGWPHVPLAPVKACTCFEGYVQRIFNPLWLYTASAAAWLGVLRRIR